MEFTKEQLQIIESALEDTRDNTGDVVWAEEIQSVLMEVRDQLKQRQIHDF
tara:strand:- start:326 stop:478 length:153 start_codon:yes stop_codon:yes gene_type:complete